MYLVTRRPDRHDERRRRQRDDDGQPDDDRSPLAPAEDKNQAQAIADQLVGQARAAIATPGAAGTSIREGTFRGDALRAAEALAKLDATVSDAQRSQYQESADPPTVMAVSAGAAYPRTIVARTETAGGKPVLYLLVALDEAGGYRVQARLPMLRGGTIPDVIPPTTGSPWLGDGADLVLSPVDFAGHYAAGLAYPPAAGQPAGLPIQPDDFATARRADVQKQAEALGSNGTLVEAHVPQAVEGGLRLAGSSGALAFVTLRRIDTITAASGQNVKNPADVATLMGRSTASRVDAEYLEFLAVVLPVSGNASVVGAESQLVSATGS